MRSWIEALMALHGDLTESGAASPADESDQAANQIVERACRRNSRPAWQPTASDLWQVLGRCAKPRWNSGARRGAPPWNSSTHFATESGQLTTGTFVLKESV